MFTTWNLTRRGDADFDLDFDLDLDLDFDRGLHFYREKP